MPPGVVLCAWTTPAAAATKHQGSMAPIGDIRLTGPRTKRSLAIPSIRPGTCWSLQSP